MKHILFEEWYSQQKYRPHAIWHEDEQRYTVMTEKQSMWEAWSAAFDYMSNLNKDLKLPI